MKEQLSAVVSAETGNVIAICSNIDDAIDIAVNYEMRSGKKFEIQDVSKYGAKEMVDRKWVKQTSNVVEICASKAK
jgi:hypothetical protein